MTKHRLAELGSDGTIGGPGGSPVSTLVNDQTTFNLVSNGGAKADAIQATGSITTGTNQLTLAGVTTAAVGMTVYVPGAGANINLGATGGGVAVPSAYKGKINSVAAGVATMDTNASNTATNMLCTYGTAIDTALDLAFDSGKPVYVPPGSYIMAAFHLGKDWHKLFGIGPEFVTIYWSPGYSSLQPAAGTGLTGATSALTADAVLGATSVAVTGTPPVVAGDYVAISSTDLWEPSGTDTDSTVCTKGEIVRVQQVQGSTIYTEDPLVDLYTVAASAKVQKWVADKGDRDVSGIKFIAATTCDLDLQATNGMNLLRYGGAFNGFQCLMTFIRQSNARVTNVEIEGHTGASIVFINSLDWEVGQCRFRRSAQQGTYGYCVSSQSSQWGSMYHCHGARTSAVFDAESFGASVAAPAFMMPNRWTDVSDCTAREGPHEPFLNHLCTEFTTFKDCRVHGGNYWQPEVTHSNGFRSGGRNTKFINPVTEFVSGYGIIVFGKSPTIINPTIKNTVPNSGGVSVGIAVSGTNPGATNAVVQGGFIDGVTMTPTNTYGFGIYLYAGATGARILNHEIRNTDGHGLYIADTSNTEYVNGLTGVNIGDPAYNGGAATNLIFGTATTPLPNWHNVSGNNTGAAGSAITNKPSGLATDYSRNAGFNGYLTPQPGGFPAGWTNMVATANQAWLNRLIVSEVTVVTKLAFVISVGATVNDNVDFAIYDATGATRLYSHGSTAGLVNSAGLKVVTLTTPVTLQPNLIYWIALAYGTVGGTAATIQVLNLNSASNAILFGTGTSMLFAQNATSFPLPSSITPAAPATSLQPVIAVRTS